MKKKSKKDRIAGFLEVIMKVARGNFSVQADLSPNNDELDSLAIGLNMMIDDLKNMEELSSQNEKLKKLNAELKTAKIKADRSEKELRKYKDHLEELVRKRTGELEEKTREQERLNKLFVGREFRIKELRDKLKELEGKKLGNKKLAGAPPGEAVSLKK